MFDPARFRIELGKRLRALRLEAGLTQLQLAERTGVTNEFMSRIENGSGMPSLDTLGRLADALALRPAALLPSDEAAPGPTTRLLGIMERLNEDDQRLVVALAEQVARARGTY